MEQPPISARALGAQREGPRAGRERPENDSICRRANLVNASNIAGGMPLRARQARLGRVRGGAPRSFSGRGRERVLYYYCALALRCGPRLFSMQEIGARS